MGYESIKTEINRLKANATEAESEALSTLLQQLDSASDCERARSDLEIELKQESDVLNNFEQDAEFYERVRSIQDQIIGFFGE
ncbi:MAG: hypothetical protein GY862_27195 [Gammaproteobacteria bacterium]|nr:hypothetical protein [Gammaproteobacteria bacterium]MCP5013886.1 hypothetical protein [Ketobacter sp.]